MSSKLNGRLARLEKLAPEPEPEPEEGPDYYEQCKTLVEKHAVAIVDDALERAAFFNCIGQACITTEVAADFVFVDGSQAITHDYHTVAAWLWLGLFKSPIWLMEWWLEKQDYYNLVVHHAKEYRDGQIKRPSSAARAED